MHNSVGRSGLDRPAAMRSLASIEVLTGLTSIHHVDELGLSFLVPALLVVGLPLVLMRQVLTKSSRAALWAYDILVALVILGFGLSDGLWNHTIKMIVFLSRGASRVAMAGLPFPPVGSSFHEVTGVLSFLAALVAAFFLWQFVMSFSRQTSEVVTR